MNQINDIRESVQSRAVKSSVSGFRKSSRGKVIMPCGTGKTRVGVRVMDAMRCQLTLVICPALSLVKQNLDCYLETSAKAFDSLIVCSDSSTADEARNEYGIEVPTTTSPDEIIAAVHRCRKHGRMVVFGTYQSVEQIAQAWKRSNLPSFDLIVFDEAHRTAGTEGLFSVGLHDKHVPAKKRLYLTATPRTIRAAAKSKACQDGIETVCMDDERLYGPEFYRLEFSEAVRLGLLTDYKVIIFGVKASLAAEWASAKFDASGIAGRIGLIKAMQKYNISKVISYHSSNANSRRFAGGDSTGISFPEMFQRLKDAKQVKGNVWVRSLDGATPVNVRNETLKELSELPKTTRAVVSNCRVFTEGVDCPAVDAVAFMDPKSSVTDIVQAIGRCMRLCDGKHQSYVIVPVLIPENGEAVNETTAGRWRQVIQVVRALQQHDSRLQAPIDAYTNNAASDSKRPITRFLESVEFEGFSDSLLNEFVPRILDQRQPLDDETLHAMVNEHYVTHGQWPSADSSAAIQRAHKRLYRRGDSLPMWLERNGYKKKQIKTVWTEPFLHAIVQEHIASHGRTPSTESSGEFRSANRWLRCRNDTLRAWLRRNGYRKSQPSAKSTIRSSRSDG